MRMSGEEERMRGDEEERKSKRLRVVRPAVSSASLQSRPAPGSGHCFCKTKSRNCPRISSDCPTTGEKLKLVFF